jgi:hypothetical protein
VTGGLNHENNQLIRANISSEILNGVVVSDSSRREKVAGMVEAATRLTARLQPITT